ncbi:unnamed protein product [Rhizoctonia solani]|uniref:Uncharacterized protein n=1 Tax=Rhizoctonia solani TaxID=456999 RepID=A0A8H2WN56_9AGAM|nr:unnamed protein product [Rhizoctonia solani]
MIVAPDVIVLSWTVSHVVLPTLTLGCLVRHTSLTQYTGVLFFLMPDPAADLCEKLHLIMDEEENWNRRIVIGSTAEWLAEDHTGERKNSQVPTWSEVVALTFILEPIVKRGIKAPNDQTKAREESPWHLIHVVLDILARQELTRRKVAKEAEQALSLNSYWRAERAKGAEVQRAKEVLLLPDEYKNKLKSIASSKVSAFMRTRYSFISLHLRRMHIYETLRTRAAGVDELIKTYFPQEVPADPDHLYLKIMKDGDPEEMKSYLGERKLVYTLYREVDIWEDRLQREGIGEDIMNSLAQDPEREFSYPVEFERNFPPFMDWTELVNITLGWSRSVSNMVKTMEDIFNPTDTPSSDNFPSN